MTTLREQTDARMAKTRQVKPEFMKTIDDLMADAKAFEGGDDAVPVGERAPDFELPDARGETVSLSGLLEAGPVIVMFYRGSWCPYCNLQLRAMQERLADIHALGAQLVAISPQVPDESLSQVERDALEFVVLSDQDAEVAARYGVAWKIPDVIVEHMRNDRKMDLADVNNGNGSVLPIPATFVVGTDGGVAWRHADVDYRTRPEPSEVLAALQVLVG